MLDPEPYIARLVEDEGLTSSLDEADAMVLVATVAEMIRVGLAKQPRDADRWVNNLAAHARSVARLLADYRQHGDEHAHTQAAKIGLRWPKGSSSLVVDLLAQVPALKNR